MVEERYKTGETYSFTCELTKVIGQKDGIIPKVLLLNIENNEGVEFRDHTWVRYSKQISPYLDNMQGNERVKITFTARVEEYISIGGQKLSLRHLRGVKAL